MKLRIVLLAIALAATAIPSLRAQTLTLTFSDTFTSGQLDRSKWNYEIGNDDAAAPLPDALSFSPSGLTIRSDIRSFTAAGTTLNYTSGKISTRGHFFQTYGYFEASMKLPKGQGMWPAFWMVSEDSSWPPEIDMLEELGNDPFTAHTSLHTPPGNTTNTQANTSDADLSAGYHVYAVAWIPSSITFYIDGVQVYQVTGSSVPSKPMYIILNNAVGDSTSWAGAPNAYTVFPNTTEIQYVHAYQYNNVPNVGLSRADFSAPALVDTTTGQGVTAAQLVTPAHAGDQMQLTTSLSTMTSQVLSNQSIHVQVSDFYNQTVYSDTAVLTGQNYAANTTTPLTLPFTVPSTLGSGLYQVTLIAESSSGTHNAGAAAITQFMIGSPLPPLPGPPPLLAASPAGMNLSSLTFTTVAGRTSPTGTVTIQNSGQTAVLTNNCWKTAALPTPYTVTANTVMEFDYSTVAVPTDVEDGLYGIGLFPAGATYSPAQLNTNAFILAGSESYGISAFESSYKSLWSLQLGGTFHYIIPIGQYSSCLGAMSNLLLLMNDSVGNNNTETFSHIHIYEGTGSVPFSAKWVAYPDQSILLSSMTVSPQGVALSNNATQQFTVTGTDANGSSLTPNVAWSVLSGPGTINPTTGLYTAPASGSGAFTVQASCAGVTATSSGMVGTVLTLFDDAPRNGCALTTNASLVSSPVHSGTAAYGATAGSYAQVGLTCSGVTAPAGTTTLQMYVYLASPGTQISNFMVQLGAPSYQTAYFNTTTNSAYWSLDNGAPTTSLTPNTWHLVRLNLAGAFGTNWLSTGTKLGNVVTQFTSGSESVYMDDTNLQ